MRRTLAGTVGTWLLAWAALTAADFWQDTDFTAWSAKQVEKMLTDSPWAKKVTVVVGSLREETLAGFQGGAAGLGGGGGRNPESGNEVQGLRRVTVTVAWLSAVPIRQAVVRRQAGPDAPISPDQQRRLGEDEPFYILAVVGVPLRLVARAGTIDEVKAKTTLKASRKERIAPETIRVIQDGEQSVRVEFLFPKSNAIALDDKEVVFITKLGEMDITKTFRLADMMVRGRLLL